MLAPEPLHGPDRAPLAIGFVGRCISLASVMVLYYDYVVTFGDEVERYWKSALTWPAAIFFLARYLSLPAQGLILMQSFWHGPVYSCRKLQLFHQLYVGVSQLLVAALLAMRVYALYQRARWMLLLLLGFGTLMVCFGIWTITGINNHPDSDRRPFGCHIEISPTDGMRLGLTWISALLFDTLVFLLTLYQGLKAWRSCGHDLYLVLVRDGLVYFGAIVGVHLVNILCLTLATPSVKGAATPFTNTLSTTLICRLMLNIRDPSIRPSTQINLSSVLDARDQDSVWQPSSSGTDSATSLWTEDSAPGLKDVEMQVQTHCVVAKESLGDMDMCCLYTRQPFGS